MISHLENNFTDQEFLRTPDEQDELNFLEHPFFSFPGISFDLRYYPQSEITKYWNSMEEDIRIYFKS